MTERYAKKILGEKDIELVLRRLDRLIVKESRMAIAQALDVVYGVVNIMQMTMESAHRQSV